MRKMIYIITLVLLASCTKNNFIDTGISNGRHEGKNILEYMAAHSYDWDSTILMIRHAGAEMIRLFEGEDPAHKEITFFGPTNHSIRRFLLERGYKRVTEIDADWCRSILLQHVVDGKIYRKDIPQGQAGLYGTVGTGGTFFNTLAATRIWVYVDLQEAGGIVENAAKPIYINFTKANKLVAVASGDIEPDNGIVHALEYSFTIGTEE